MFNDMQVLQLLRFLGAYIAFFRHFRKDVDLSILFSGCN